MYVQKIEQEKVAKERGETKDNRSFIAKYVSCLVNEISSSQTSYTIYTTCALLFCFFSSGCTLCH